jgi:hypothetical protein
MKTPLKSLLVVLLSLGSGSAFAEPADAVGEQAELTVLADSASGSCGKGSLCASAAERGTQAVGSLLAAAGGPGAALVVATEPPGFVRELPVAASASAADLTPWSLRLDARLRQPALAGNALFLIADADDPEQALGTRTVTAMWQAPIPAGERLAVQLRLRPNEGFRAGHSYRIWVVQIVKGQELELAAGEIRLR